MKNACKIWALSLVLCATSAPLTIDPVEAAGVRASRVALRAAKRGPAPRLVSNRVTTTRNATTRLGTPRVSVSTRSVSNTRVASFVQRAPTTAATRLAAARQAVDGGGAATFVNGLRRNDLEFRTGDFFERQQSIGSQ